MLIKGGFGSERMAKVGTSQLVGVLVLQGWNEHAVIIHQYQRPILFHQDVVGLQVAMRKRLREQPRSHAAEAISQQLQDVGVMQVRLQIVVERYAFCPIHH